MNTLLAGSLVVPGVVALVFLLVISYLQRQTRERQFLLWELTWAAYCAHFVLVAASVVSGSWVLLALARTCLVGMMLALVISGRWMRRASEPSLHWTEIALALGGIAWAFLGLAPTPIARLFSRTSPEIGMAVVFAFAAWRFYRIGTRRDSLGFRVIAISLGIWALLLDATQFGVYFPRLAALAAVLHPVPQVLLGVSMVMVMFEHERRTVQENALALSSLDVDAAKLHTPSDLESAVTKLLDRLLPQTRTNRALLYIAEPYRGILPSVQRGWSSDVFHHILREDLCKPLVDLVYRRGGVATLRSPGFDNQPGLGPDTQKALSALFEACGAATAITAIGIQGRDRQLGVLLFPHASKRTFGAAELRLLLALTMQVGTTLDNYVLMHEAHRRTRESEMLTQIGQAISSRLDPDEVLRAIHTELSRLFDAGTFYIAFTDGNDLRFEFETIEGVVQPKRSRTKVNGLAEYIVRTGEPLLIRSDVLERKAKLGVSYGGRGARSFVGVPITMGGRTAGAVCALSFDREFVFEQRDLEVLQTAAGQLAVAMENALLYSEANRRAQYLLFLNNVANTAISSQDTEDMLAAIVSEIQKNFDFDHIGIGIVDYKSKDIEIKAEAGSASGLIGRRIPVGVGILGRVARSGETAVIQNKGEPHLLGLLPDARSVICIPLRYGETLLGLLNVESRKENAFAQQDILLLNTLADLVATALHNAMVFQKMQQQSITDSLTGVKTRGYFLEALQSEWKRASRSGRPFSIVLIDLDKFKEVNDTMGHLEGDLVLARVGRLLEQKCRQSNVVARYGGDEFMVLMPETSVDQGQILAERLRLWLATDPMLNERRVTGSFGVASFPIHGGTVEELIRVADAGMYVSKHAGGNRVSTAEIPRDAYDGALEHRQRLLSFIDSFLNRDRIEVKDSDELVSALRRLSAPLPPEQCRELLMEAMKTIVHAAELREAGASTHGDAVSTYAEILGRRVGFTEKEIEELRFAAAVHDIGKLVVPAEILNYSGVLSPESRRIVERHTIFGSDLVNLLPGGSVMANWVRHHHERMDGTGYPDRLAGEAIPLGARIIAVADAYVTMTTDLPFSAARSPGEALAELESIPHLLDAKLIRALAEHVRSISSSAARAHD